ncbi:uncharacterized protein LOC116529916 isoform X2 [Sapajus apella]|uniref:Uncharacterized protein LOC116529916 isoform X2 n=1 Tax=Sapajus apella TaxID=9515 RepID=A0A6J3FDH1_SAPAP|nr:uncharacterized protein LOC116529916 isoform X2 [Sapajus apella]
MALGKQGKDAGSFGKHSPPAQHPLRAAAGVLHAAVSSSGPPVPRAAWAPAPALCNTVNPVSSRFQSNGRPSKFPSQWRSAVLNPSSHEAFQGWPDLEFKQQLRPPWSEQWPGLRMRRACPLAATVLHGSSEGSRAVQPPVSSRGRREEAQEESRSAPKSHPLSLPDISPRCPALAPSSCSGLLAGRCLQLLCGIQAPRRRTLAVDPLRSLIKALLSLLLICREDPPAERHALPAEAHRQPPGTRRAAFLPTRPPEEATTLPALALNPVAELQFRRCPVAQMWGRGGTIQKALQNC